MGTDGRKRRLRFEDAVRLESCRSPPCLVRYIQQHDVLFPSNGSCINGFPQWHPRRFDLIFGCIHDPSSTNNVYASGF